MKNFKLLFLPLVFFAFGCTHSPSAPERNTSSAAEPQSLPKLICAARWHQTCAACNAGKVVGKLEIDMNELTNENPVLKKMLFTKAPYALSVEVTRFAVALALEKEEGGQMQRVTRSQTSPTLDMAPMNGFAKLSLDANSVDLGDLTSSCYYPEKN